MRRLARWKLLSGLLIAIGIMLPFAVGPGYVLLEGYRIDQKQRLLLYQTDHNALLAACRSLIQRRAEYGEGGISGRDPRLPGVIRRLGSQWVDIQEDLVHIEMGGGFFHYGFWAMADSKEQPY